MLRKLLSVVGVSSLLIIAPLTVASAANLPVKAPPPPPAPPIANWTGLTLDVDAGWQNNSFTWLYSNFPGEIPFNMSASQAVIGGHIGYQQQFNWLVAGVEFGVSAPQQVKYASVTSVGIISAPCGTGTAGEICQATIGSVDTLGGKLGVAWQDWLFYGDGGGARGSVQSQLTNANGTCCFDTASGTYKKGWYAGGGVDYMFVKAQLVDVIGGIAYEHIGLGTNLLPSSADGGNPSGVNARTVSAKEDIVWAKVTLKFNPWGAGH